MDNIGISFSITKPIMNNKNHFLLLATLFETSLVLMAQWLGDVFSIDPVANLTLDQKGLAWGLACTPPLYLLLHIYYDHPAIQALRQRFMDPLAEIFQAMNMLERLYLGFLAGTTEEIFFRGMLQPFLEQDWGILGGLLFSNMVFALAHWVTPLYGVLAGLCGIYLGWTMDMTGERVLLIPVVIHSLYDFLAFSLLARRPTSARPE